MPLTKAEKFKLLSGGVEGGPAENAKDDSRNSKRNPQIETSLSGGGDLSPGVGSRSPTTRAGEMTALVSTRPASIKLGQPAPPELSFCPVQAVNKYPYKYIRDKTLQDSVANSFFAGGKFFERSWNIFYIYPPRDISPKPLLLLSFLEVLSFFEIINKETRPPLKFPSKSEGFQISFSEMDPTLRPRYLGESSGKNEFKNLEQTVPSASFRPDGENLNLPPSERTLAAFRKAMELAQDATKNKSKAVKARKQLQRAEKQRGWGRQIKRSQRYLGLRQRKERVELEQVFRQDLKINHTPLDVTMPAPYEMEGSAIFIAIDVESYERDHKRITEVGISVLDTEDLGGVPPGKDGGQWMEKIQTRHLRVREHSHLRNKDFVAGCAERFEFGESEWVTLKDAPLVVAECFRPSPPGQPLRNIIIVGHDVYSDIDYLKVLGYNPLNLSNLIEILDTNIMYRFLKREQNPRNLGSVLADLGLMGWNLHNAGNDATYTLQAMVALAVKATTDKDASWPEEQRKRAGEAAREAVERELELGEGWSSAGEGSDGGFAETPSEVNSDSLLGNIGADEMDVGDETRIRTEGRIRNEGGNKNGNAEGGGQKNAQRGGREDGPRNNQRNNRRGAHRRGQWNRQRGNTTTNNNKSARGPRLGASPPKIADDPASLV
ncbi:MAG: hypothetical protein M1839_000779 [Geoglossum umbratile]|nr:MAG: hypothetical protein M1839_000779 [Geoglossum umbratile]